MKRLLLVITFLLTAILASKGFHNVTPSAKFSVLTCTPGPELYSVFGHSAIRYQDSVNGKWRDWVYNYGTFEFSDDFYVKFARGKLDYMLSKSSFPEFQYEYIVTGRGIQEQVLNLTTEETQRLIDLLEENVKPENCTYRYDFFYDNCSSRIRDMLQKATQQKINFTYRAPRIYTFRQAIQHYLDYMHWSDFGIDLALGMPCDREMAPGDDMFLPDSLFNEINFASLGEGALSKPAEEILPAEYELTLEDAITPIRVFGIFLFVSIILGYYFLRKGRKVIITDRILLLISGLVGVLVIFLWFFTDHTATKWNLNLLWANPLSFWLMFSSPSKMKPWLKKWLVVYALILILLIGFWFFLPQRLHLAVLPIVLGLFFYTLKVLRPQLFGLKQL